MNRAKAREILLEEFPEIGDISEKTISNTLSKKLGYTYRTIPK